MELARVRRLRNITDALSERGVLPTFYQLPERQLQLEREMRSRVGPRLARIADEAAELEDLLDRAAVDRVTGQVVADLENELEELYAQFGEESARFGVTEADSISNIPLEWAIAAGIILAGIPPLAGQGSQAVLGRVRADVQDIAARGTTHEGIRGNLVVKSEHILGPEADRIARTEVSHYKNYGAFNAYVAHEVELIQWLTMMDEAVRPWHSVLHGETVESGQLFSNGLEYPGDHTGPVDEWINCRCFIMGVR